MSTSLPCTISIVTVLSSTRSVERTDVVPFLAMAPSDGSSTSLLVTLRRQRRPVRAVCAVTSNWSERGVVKPTGQLWFTLTVFTSMHSPLAIVVGRTIVTVQLPADVAGAPQLTGVGVGLGAGVGVGEGVGVGDGEGEGDADGLGEGEGDADGLGEGLGDGDAPGDGEAPGTTLTCTVAVAWDEPERATRLKLVVHAGVTWRVPLAVTVPIPLSSSTVSAPSTSQVSVAAAPELMSAGVATNFWMARVEGSVNSFTRPQRTAAIPRRISNMRRKEGRPLARSSIKNPFKVGV